MHTGPLYIFNIYNDQEHDKTLDIFRDTLDNLCWNLELQPDNQNQDPLLLWAGNFNCHHPFWKLPNNEHLLTRAYLDSAQLLVDRVAENGLSMILPPELPTLWAYGTGNLTQPDNAFVSDNLAARLISCEVFSHLTPPCCDYFPIHISFDLTCEAAPKHFAWWN